MQKSVLIVEDELVIALDLQQILEVQGWRVIGPATSVRGALRLLETESPSVAVLDLNLGRELVTPVAELLRARRIPFVLASAMSKPAAVGGEVFLGATNVGKPFNEHDLTAAVNAALSRSVLRPSASCPR